MDNIRSMTERLRRRWWTALLGFALVGATATTSFAEPPASDANSATDEASEGNILLTQFRETRSNRNNSRSWANGTSSAEAKQVAVRELPLNKLSPVDRNRVAQVVNSAGMFRRLPTIVFESDPDAYEFLVYHPDVAASIWRAMNISKLQLWQTARFEYEGDAQDGTIGTLDVLFQSPTLNLVYCQGEFKSPLVPKPIEAESVILLRTSYSKEADGKIYITHSADLYVSFPSQTVESIAKILSPVSGRIADRTFSEISAFMKMMSLAMAQRPGWVENLVGKMGGIPDLRRQQLMKLTAKVYTAELKRQGKAPQTAKSTETPFRQSDRPPTRTARTLDMNRTR